MVSWSATAAAQRNATGEMPPDLQCACVAHAIHGDTWGFSKQISGLSRACLVLTNEFGARERRCRLFRRRKKSVAIYRGLRQNVGILLVNRIKNQRGTER